MKLSLDGLANGLGSSFFRPSSALLTIPLGSPSRAGRSNRMTGTLALTRCAAICAPITPAPRTATLRTWKFVLITTSLLMFPLCIGFAAERLGLHSHAERGNDQTVPLFAHAEKWWA